MQLKHLHELFILQIKDLYSAENQLIKSLKKMSKKVLNEQLKTYLNAHIQQTEQQIQRLEEIASNLEFNPKGHVCKSMKGLIEEAQEFLNIKGHSEIIDVALISSAKKVEYYEMSSYDTAISLAKIMNHNIEVELLEQNINEERGFNQKLSKLAESGVNQRALDVKMSIEKE